ncbi:hypothetical protein FQR65_LT12650 [Abscondita terminalis]|nr:hypothetical protein FQR65_LT12650 [Abscondita terminalis]
MDLYGKLKRFLGLPAFSSDIQDHSNIVEPTLRDHYNEKPIDESEQFGFNVFTNPLEMHRYFEHQMNEMMKSFGIFNKDSSFFDNDESMFGGFKESAPFDFDGNLRDNFLKPGYEDPANRKYIKGDTDLDEQYQSGDFKRNSIQKPSALQKFSFGQTTITKTFRNSDGITEVYKSVKNHDGNREETVTRKQGDKEYTVVTKTDKNGIQEITENLLNLDDSEKEAFMKNNNSFKPDRSKDNFDVSLFQKLFGN